MEKNHENSSTSRTVVSLSQNPHRSFFLNKNVFNSKNGTELHLSHGSMNISRYILHLTNNAHTSRTISVKGDRVQTPTSMRGPLHVQYITVIPPLETVISVTKIW